MAFGTATVLTEKGYAITSARLIGGASPAQTEPKFLALGTGATGAARTAAITDTALSAELTEGRSGTNAGTQASVTYTNDTYTVTNTITASDSRAVDEGGLFDVVTTSSGNMFVSATFPVVNLLSGDSLQITTKVTFS
jgi:hypothetical protein